MKIYFRLCLLASVSLAGPVLAMAQTDEIQVYDSAIEDNGKLGLMLHSNFTPKGAKTPAFPGAIVPNHAFVGVAEWAYGVSSWFEAGLYMPLYSISDSGADFNG